jgi:hypothetical protein
MARTCTETAYILIPMFWNPCTAFNRYVGSKRVRHQKERMLCMKLGLHALTKPDWIVPPFIVPVVFIQPGCGWIEFGYSGEDADDVPDSRARCVPGNRLNSRVLLVKV